ncbi:MAG: ABC transporter permease [bacterium]
MNLRESLGVGWEGLFAHKLRSFLTMLGIIFGVAAVIAMLSIGEGAKREALEQIKLMGMNNILIQDAGLEEKELAEAREKQSRGLTRADARAIEAICPMVEVAAPQKEEDFDIRLGSKTVKATVVGTVPPYPWVLNFHPRRGSFITPSDMAEHRRVSVLGNAIKRELFPFEDPVGKRVKLGDTWFTVIGVMEDKNIVAGKAGALAVRNLNRDVYIPITTAFKRFKHEPMESEVDQITVKVRDAAKIREAANIIKNILDRRHHGVEDYQIIIPEELLRASQRTQRIFNIVMGAIAGISLLVGGIGIMNIMLATVLERTREIGVRRAIGARQRDILGQFLIEAVVLSFSGGAVGIALGVFMTKVVTLYAGWKTVVSLGAIGVAFGVSAGVGMIFGIYPARKAARLDPIEALRYE